MARACPRLLRYGRFIWSRPKRQAQHCLPFLFPLYRLPYARYGCAIQRKFHSQLNRPRRSANMADRGSRYGQFIWSRPKERGEAALLLSMGALLAVWKYSFGSAHRFCSQLNRPRHSANMSDRGGRYGRFIWSRPKRQAQHCLPFLFSLYRLPYARYGCAIQRKFCSQLNRPRHGANIRYFQAFPSGGRGTASAVDEVFVRKAKRVVEGCFSVSLAKSSVFSRRRKTHEEHIVFRGAMPPTGSQRKLFMAYRCFRRAPSVSRCNLTDATIVGPTPTATRPMVTKKQAISLAFFYLFMHAAASARAAGRRAR